MCGCVTTMSGLIYKFLFSFPSFNAGNSNTIVALAGNKADLLEARQVPAEVC
jgi:hypothetical protein